MLKFIMMAMMMIITTTKNPTMTLTLLAIGYNLSLQTVLNAKTTYFLSSDLISFWITNMSIMVFYVLTMLKQKSMAEHKKLMAMMTLITLMTFNSWNFVMYFIMFEMSMIAIILVIMTWGYQPERLEAMMFMIIMTLMFSLPLLVSMMNKKSEMNFWFISPTPELMTFLSFIFVFMMKMPIYFTHFWLPKAHVEAPVQGSMILAAILLKLGCYGVLRMSPLITQFKKITPIMLSVSITSMIILSVNCIMQIDLKTLIAYSSIVHMTMVFMNLMLMKMKSVYSSMLIIVGHGLCSAALFFMANMMYSNSKSRSILLNKGMLTVLPAGSLMWFAACMNNAPMPPSMNMMGELISFKNLLSWSKMLYASIIAAAMTSSMYSIYVFLPPSHGPISKLTKKLKINTTEYSIMMTMMMVPIMVITLKPSMMMN